MLKSFKVLFLNDDLLKNLFLLKVVFALGDWPHESFNYKVKVKVFEIILIDNFIDSLFQLSFDVVEKQRFILFLSSWDCLFVF